MTWFDQILTQLARLLTAIGVTEGDSSLWALGIFYVAAILSVGFFLLLIWRLRRRRGKGPDPAPADTSAAISPPSRPAAEPPAVEPAEALPAVEPADALPAGVPAEAPPVTPVPPPMPGPGLFERMRAGLSKTQAAVVGQLDALLRGGRTRDELFDDLEEILVGADFGVKATQDLIRALKGRLDRSGAASPDQVRTLLKEEIRNCLQRDAEPFDLETAPPLVVMVVGVNGVGKTTTIGKLARQFTARGKKVVLGAGDTFRAAAADQLAVWAERAGADLIRHDAGGDPAAVAFDAAKAAQARGADILILDTAGRLHTKVNLMEELKKIRRVLAREIPGAPHEVLLVLDATTGQNALSQARQFKEAVAVTGLVLTKLDGTAKGGIVVAIGAEMDLPVRFVGIGESVDDLRPFDPDLFVEALFAGEEKP